MKRRKAREYVLQYLFQVDFLDKKQRENGLKQFWSDKKEDPEVEEFATDLIKGTLARLDEIDPEIEKAADRPVRRLLTL